MLPPEIAIRIAQECPPKQWPILNTLPPFRRALHDEYFWLLQCQRARLPARGDCRSLYRQFYTTTRNWRDGRYRRRLYDTDGQVCLVLDGKDNRILSAALPTDGAHFWDLQTGTRILRVGDNVCAAAIEGNTLVCGTRDGLLLMRDLREAGCIRRIVAHQGELSVLALRADFVVTGGSDGIAKVWDLRGTLGGAIRSKHCHSPISAVAISRDREIACGTVNGSVHLFDRQKAAPSAVPRSAVNCMCFQRDHLIIGCDDGHIHKLFPDGALRNAVVGTSAIVSFHKSEQRLVAGHADGLISIHHDLQALDTATYIHAGHSIVWQVFADQTRLLSSSLDRQLTLYDFS